jgi:hypothetical protein
MASKAAYARQWRKENPDLAKDHILHANYGVPIGEYQRMFDAQKGRCAICGRDNSGKANQRFHVDHDHKTGSIRGLLCHGCNVSIGHFRENDQILLNAIKYLAKCSVER